MDWKIIHLDETDSTNRWLRAQQGEEDIVVTTDYQSAGRGCGTNSWESERGKNLLFSVRCHPTDIPANRQFVISEATALAISDSLTTYIDKVNVKWPNDIYVGNRKICGILIENRLTGTHIKDCIIGIGLNVNQQHFVSDAPNPVSLCQLLGHEVDREALLHDILRRFCDNLIHWESLHDTYCALLYRREGFHRYEDQNGILEAKLVTVTPNGRLVLEEHNGQQRSYAFKEVKFK